MIRARRQAGFSLIEVMVAVLILGVSLVALVNGISTALIGSKEAEVQSVASLLAAGRIEMLRAAPAIAPEADSGSGEFAGDLAIYSWRQTVEKTNVEGLYDVTVAIEMTDSGKEIYQLRTMLFDPPYVPLEDEQDTTRKKRKT